MRTARKAVRGSLTVRYPRAWLAGMTILCQILPVHSVVFLVYPGFELLDVSGPAAVFNGANRALLTAGQPAFYQVELAAADGGLVESSCGMEVQVSAAAMFGEAWIGTLLVGGAEREPLLSAVADDRLREQLPGLAARADRFGSVCSGGFLLAAAGLIDGRRVATHWDSYQALAQAFPDVTVDADAMYVVDGPVWTSAGVSTGIDMALAMVATDLGAPVAGEVARRLVLYARRPGYQSQFSPILDAQARADSPFAELIGWIQSNLGGTLDVASLAERSNMTERTFYRRFAASVGETPARFVETARLDAARLLLARGVSLKSTAAKVGLFPPARLAEAFERRFGISPTVFRAMHAEL